MYSRGPDIDGGIARADLSTVCIGLVYCLASDLELHFLFEQTLG